MFRFKKIKDTIKRALNSNPKTITLVGAMGFALTTLNLSKGLKEAIGISSSKALGILVAFCFCVLSYNFIIVYRRKRQPEPSTDVRMATIKYLMKKMRGFEDYSEWHRRDVDLVQLALNEVAEMFKQLTNTTDVCASLQVVIKDDSDPSNIALENLCRDSLNQFVRNFPEYLATPHIIRENTTYLTIMQSILRGDLVDAFYLNNNIPNTPHYENSSAHLYPNGVLPYKSELCVPLAIAINRNTILFLGFLCLDSPKKNIFDRHRDVTVIQRARTLLLKAMETKYPQHFTVLSLCK